jgi:hypothetical protein
VKTIEVKNNEATKRINVYAERLRELVIDALSEGIQLEIPVIERGGALNKKSHGVEQYVVTAAIPNRWQHPYYNQPLWVRARGVIVNCQPDYEENRVLPPNDELLAANGSGGGE